MSDLYRTITTACSRVSLILTVSLLAFGLTGCYTQLKTADPASRARSAPRVEQGQTQAKPSAEEPTYADEYRREYRSGDSDVDDGYYGYEGTKYGDSYDYLYEYKYKYKYGAPYQYRSRYGGWCDDAFFHDPWYYDSWCGPTYGSRFSVSFHYGSPFYYHRPLGRRYYSSWYGYGGWPYSNYYFGNQYYYYGDVDGFEDDEREYLSRRATIRGATNAGESSASGQSVNGPTRSIHSSSSGGRIGRSGEATGRVGRTTRSWAVERPARTSEEGRIGRSTRTTIDRSRDARTRSDDRVRTRRPRASDDNRRSGVRQRTPTRDRSRATSPRSTTRSSNDGSRTRTRSSSGDRSRSDSSNGRSRSRGGSSDDGDSR